MPNVVKKSQLWYIPERRESFTSRSAEVINVYPSYFLAITEQVSAPYLKLLDTLNIDISIFKLQISLLAHKISQNEANIPEVFQNYLVKVSDFHSHNTRYA